MTAAGGGVPDGRLAPIAYDRAVQLSPLVRRITQRNPGPLTGTGTNTHVVGRAGVFVLDPGEDRNDGHLERVVRAVGTARVHGVIPSHGHEDHWPLAPRLAAALGAPVLFFRRHPAFAVDREIRDGEVLEGEGVKLVALHTPGHARDHLSFTLAQEHALFPGDHVMGWSTSIIDPPDGDLTQYLASLERLLAVSGLEVMYPAHGEAIAAPYARMRELRAHREERTRQALAALGDGPQPIGMLVARIYADVDAALHPAAARSLAAHLLALEQAGRVERVPPGAAVEDALWRTSPPPAR